MESNFLCRQIATGQGGMFFNLKEGTRGNYLFRRCRNTGEAVGVPSLDALKARLDGVVDSLI